MQQDKRPRTFILTINSKKKENFSGGGRTSGAGCLTCHGRKNEFCFGWGIITSLWGRSFPYQFQASGKAVEHEVIGAKRPSCFRLISATGVGGGKKGEGCDRETFLSGSREQKSGKKKTKNGLLLQLDSGDWDSKTKGLIHAGSNLLQGGNVRIFQEKKVFPDNSFGGSLKTLTSPK